MFGVLMFIGGIVIIVWGIVELDPIGFVGVFALLFGFGCLYQDLHECEGCQIVVIFVIAVIITYTLCVLFGFENVGNFLGEVYT